MTEELIMLGITTVISIIGFFAAKWMSAVEGRCRKNTERIETLEQRVSVKIEAFDDLHKHAITESVCTANNNELMKHINRERYRVNTLEDRLNSGEFKPRIPKKSFSELGVDHGDNDITRIIRGGR